MSYVTCSSEMSHTVFYIDKHTALCYFVSLCGVSILRKVGSFHRVLGFLSPQ